MGDVGRGENVGTDPGGSALSDEQIVRGVCAGDHELFEVLLKRYSERVYRVARSVLRDEREAEEVAQEVWVRAFHHLNQLSRQYRFATWLVRIALHESWAHARVVRRRLALTGNRAEEIARVHAPSPDPEELTLIREFEASVEAAIEILPERYRTVFLLREVEELSTAEVARSLKLSPMAVKTRLHRARGLLRDQLAARSRPGLV